MKRIALVGFAENSRIGVPYDDKTVEIWSLNEAYNSGFLERWDKWFQIHARHDFTRLNNFNDPDHWKWLQNEGDIRDTGFPIIMQEAYPDVPGSVRFPMEVIEEAHKGEDLVFSSTFAYMMAYAIHIEKADEILVYGFDMANNTDYRYQRPNGEYWIGYARGKGIKVTIPEESVLCKGPRYGFDYSANINNIHLSAIIEKQAEIEAEEKEKYQKSERKFRQINEAYEASKTDALRVAKEKAEKNLSRDVANANVQLGILQELQLLLKLVTDQHEDIPEVLGDIPFEGFLNRQHLDFRRIFLENEMQKITMERNTKIGYKQALLDLADFDMSFPVPYQEEMQKLHRNITEITSYYNVLMGRISIIEFLIHMIDMQYADKDGDITKRIKQRLEGDYVTETKEE